MTWQLSMVLFFAFSTSLALWRRVFSQNSTLHGRVAPALSFVLGVMPLGIIVGLSKRDWQFRNEPKTYVLLVLMAIFVALFNALVFVVSKKLPVALFQTIFQIQAVTVVVLGWLFLNETLTFMQFVGALLLLAGATLAAQSHKEKQAHHFAGSTVLLAVLASVSLGAGVTAEKAALGQMSLGTYYVIGFGMQTVVSCIIAQRELRKTTWRKLHRYDWLGAAFMGVLSACTGFFFIYSLQTADNAGLVSVVGTFQMPLIAIAGYYVLKEKEIGWKLALALVVAFCGLLITAF